MILKQTAPAGRPEPRHTKRFSDAVAADAHFESGDLYAPFAVISPRLQISCPAVADAHSPAQTRHILYTSERLECFALSTCGGQTHQQFCTAHAAGHSGAAAEGSCSATPGPNETAARAAHADRPGWLKHGLSGSGRPCRSGGIVARQQTAASRLGILDTECAAPIHQFIDIGLQYVHDRGRRALSREG